MEHKYDEKLYSVMSEYGYGDSEKMAENMIYSPYFPIACKMLWKSNIDDPNFADLLETMSKIAVIDNKINQTK
jgi:hypothetical protein